MQHIVADAWRGLRLSGRSDLHCYFWPAAARYLKEGGYLGFLTSSSWLDVEYGFAVEMLDRAREGHAVTIAPLTTPLSTPPPDAPAP